LEINGSRNPVFESKKPVFEGFGVKVKKTGPKRGVSKHSKFTENLEFVLFQTFRKSQKNDIKIEVWKLRKTRTDLKTNSNVRFKVQNAGPYLFDLSFLFLIKKKCISRFFPISHSRQTLA